MTNHNRAFFCGVAAGVVATLLCDALKRPARQQQQHIRSSGRREMKNPPRLWDMVY